MGQLANKVAIVTGAAGGLGRAFAVAFAREGARVVCADLNVTGAQETAEMIHQHGGAAIAAALDVTNEASAQLMAQETVDEWGQIDVLVNNAAIYACLLYTSPSPRDPE